VRQRETKKVERKERREERSRDLNKCKERKEKKKGREEKGGSNKTKHQAVFLGTDRPNREQIVIYEKTERNG